MSGAMAYNDHRHGGKRGCSRPNAFFQAPSARPHVMESPLGLASSPCGVSTQHLTDNSVLLRSNAIDLVSTNFDGSVTARLRRWDLPRRCRTPGDNTEATFNPKMAGMETGGPQKTPA